MSEAVDELVFQTVAPPWTVVFTEGMHPLGPETEPPAALAHFAPRLPAFSFYQTSVSRNTQGPLFAIWHGRGLFDKRPLNTCLWITCPRLYEHVQLPICPSIPDLYGVCMNACVSML